jgi:DNA-binding response OmpR family regulator
MKHALIIEDNHLIAMMIEDELIALGYGSAAVATTLEQAIEMARLSCPDLITVCDMLDSGAGVQTIREICRGRSIPVVFITAREDEVKAMIFGAVIIAKPFWIPHLGAAVEAAICTPLRFR